MRLSQYISMTSDLHSAPAMVTRDARIITTRLNGNSGRIASIGLITAICLIVIMLTAPLGGTGMNTGVRKENFPRDPSSIYAPNEIPSQYVPIFLAAQRKYGVSWNVLAAIARTESDFGRDMATSSAGAVGFMQFMPVTWQEYAVSPVGDNPPNPYDPWDAVFTAARMLRANGFAQNPYVAIYRYNHAWWYVDLVMKRTMTYATRMFSVPAGPVKKSS